ncbi:MAG: type II CAAX prenyl endopeptidase Rce1 family protein [Balneolaceae bacterium]
MQIRQFVLWLEFTLLFIGMPLIYFFEILTIPAIPALLIFLTLCLILLWQDSSIKIKTHLNQKASRQMIRKIILRFLAFGSLLIMVVWFFIPDRLFYMPLNQPYLWMLLILLYPFLSALPQEIIYRLFLFHRYQTLVSNKQILVFMSIASFAFLHIIYHNWIAVLLTFLGGILFTQTYLKTNSVLSATLEHSLYGVLIFTAGLGSYFYNG